MYTIQIRMKQIETCFLVCLKIQEDTIIVWSVLNRSFPWLNEIQYLFQERLLSLSSLFSIEFELGLDSLLNFFRERYT